MRGADLTRLIVLAAIWGASFLLMRITAPVLGAVPTAFGRVMLGALGLWALVAAQRQALDFRGHWRATCLLGVVNSGIPFLMYALAARVLPAGYSAILNAVTPLMGVLIGAAFFRDPLSASKIGGVVLGLAGVAVLTRTGPVVPTAAVLAGIAACLAATFCYGLGAYLTRHLITARGGLDSRLVALGSQVGAAALLGPALLAQALWPGAPALPTLADLTWSTGAGLLALGLVCTAFAYILYFRLLADIGPVKASTVTFLIPLFGVLWGAALLGETLTAAHAAGGCLIAVALALVLRPAPAAGPAPART